MHLPTELTKSIRLPSDAADYQDPFVANGQRAVWATEGALYLADIADRDIHRIARIGNNYNYDPWAIAFDNDRVVWLQVDYPEVLGSNAPCPIGTAGTWTVVVLDLASGDRQTVATGSQPPSSDCRQSDAVRIALDGDQLALAEPDQGRTWSITIRDLGSGSTTETVSVPGPVESVDLSGMDLAYSYGQLTTIVDEGGVARTIIADTHLMLSTTAIPYPVEVATDAYGVLVDKGRAVWMRGHDYSSTQHDGELMTSLVEDWRPIELASIPFVGFTVGDGLVSWLGDNMDVWQADAGRAARLDFSQAGGGGAISVPTVSEGWLTWQGSLDYYAGTMHFYEVPDSSLPF